MVDGVAGGVNEKDESIDVGISSSNGDAGSLTWISVNDQREVEKVASLGVLPWKLKADDVSMVSSLEMLDASLSLRQVIRAIVVSLLEWVASLVDISLVICRSDGWD